jgi:hypothetical protein
VLNSTSRVFVLNSGDAHVTALITDETPIRVARAWPQEPPNLAHLGSGTAGSAGQAMIFDIYLQMDDQLTRMAEIQVQFDRLRSRIRLL